MKEINLRELYPSIYKTDTYAEVSDDVLEAIKAHERAEAARERKMYRYKAHYSLDRGDGIEHDALYQPPTPEEIVLEQTVREKLYAAIMALPEKQAKRLYATLYDLMKKRPFRIYKIDNKTRIDRVDFDRWYHSQNFYRTVEDQQKDHEKYHDTLTMPEIARILGIHRNTVYTMVKAGKFITIDTGRKKRVPKASFEKWYQSQSHYKKIGGDERGINR